MDQKRKRVGIKIEAPRIESLSKTFIILAVASVCFVLMQLWLFGMEILNKNVFVR